MQKLHLVPLEIAFESIVAGISKYLDSDKDMCCLLFTPYLQFYNGRMMKGILVSNDVIPGGTPRTLLRVLHDPVPDEGKEVGYLVVPEQGAISSIRGPSIDGDLMARVADDILRRFIADAPERVLPPLPYRVRLSDHGLELVRYRDDQAQTTFTFSHQDIVTANKLRQLEKRLGERRFASLVNQTVKACLRDDRTDFLFTLLLEND